MSHTQIPQPRLLWIMPTTRRTSPPSRRPSPAVAFVLLLALATGCGGGGGGGTPPTGTGQITVLSPPANGTIAAGSIAVEVARVAWTEVAVVQDQQRLLAVPDGDRTLVPEVPLAEGRNELRVEAKDATGRLVTTTIVITGAPFSQVAELTAAPEFATGLPAQIALHAAIAPTVDPVSAYLLDHDGNGTFTSSVPSFPTTLDYPTAGQFWPRALARTSTGFLVPMRTRRSVRILDAAAVTPPTEITLAAPATDLAWDVGHERLVVLSNQLQVFDAAGTVVFTEPSLNAQNCTAITTDSRGNLYCVLGSTGQVQRRLFATGYAPDTALSPEGIFGAPGTANSFFMSPAGIATADDDAEPRIYVADTGNQRIQRFGFLASFERSFDGTAGGGAALGQVRTVLALREGLLAVVPQAADRVRFCSSDGEPDQRLVDRTFTQIVDLFEARSGNLGIVDGGAGRICIYSATGLLVQEIPTAGPFAACAYRVTGGVEQLVIAPTGASRLVVHALPSANDPTLPLAMVQRFVAAMRDGDLAVARTCVVGDALARLEAMDLGAARGVAAAIQGLSVQNQTARGAMVMGRVTTVAGVRLTEFVLQREERDNTFVITAF